VGDVQRRGADDTGHHLDAPGKEILIVPGLDRATDYEGSGLC